MATYLSADSPFRVFFLASLYLEAGLGSKVTGVEKKTVEAETLLLPRPPPADLVLLRGCTNANDPV